MAVELRTPQVTRRGQGAGEHRSERTLECVSEGAEPATRASAVRCGA